MDRVHDVVHGLGPQGWSMDLGSMFSIRPAYSVKPRKNNTAAKHLRMRDLPHFRFASLAKIG